MTILTGVISSIVAAIIIGIAVEIYRRHFGKQIAITHPRPDEVMTDPEPNGDGFLFPVRGTFKHLPKHHTVWLLIEDDQTAAVRPQNFDITRNDIAKTWEGKIWGSGPGIVKITALIAPPTSQ